MIGSDPKCWTVISREDLSHRFRDCPENKKENWPAKSEEKSNEGIGKARWTSISAKSEAIFCLY